MRPTNEWGKRNGRKLWRREATYTWTVAIENFLLKYCKYTYWKNWTVWNNTYFGMASKLNTQSWCVHTYIRNQNFTTTIWYIYIYPIIIIIHKHTTIHTRPQSHKFNIPNKCQGHSIQLEPNLVLLTLYIEFVRVYSYYFGLFFVFLYYYYVCVHFVYIPSKMRSLLFNSRIRPWSCMWMNDIWCVLRMICTYKCPIFLFDNNHSTVVGR